MKLVYYIIFLLFLSVSCKDSKESPEIIIEEPVVQEDSAPKAIERKMYIDVHHVGPGKVTAAAVADAHNKDLATQDKYGVNFLEYWVDEKNGDIYCVSNSPSPEAITETHKHAHGLEPNDIVLVTDGLASDFSGKSKLFLDVHELGAGNVTAEGVAEAHEKDLATQDHYQVSFINYWVDEANGKVYCLSESPSADAVVKTHAQAHGLVPKEVVEIVRGE